MKAKTCPEVESRSRAPPPRPSAAPETRRPHWRHAPAPTHRVHEPPPRRNKRRGSAVEPKPTRAQPEERPAPIGAPPGFRHEPLDDDDLNLLEDTSVMTLDQQSCWT